MDKDELNRIGNLYGAAIAPISQVVYSVKWEPFKISLIEKFLKLYEDRYTFEYTTNGGWILRYNSTYKSLHGNDYIIIGYKDIIILNEDEFIEQFFKI